MRILAPSPTETVTCPLCRTIQFLTFRTLCRRCGQPLGFDFAAISFSPTGENSNLRSRYLACEFGRAARAIRVNHCLPRRRLAELSSTDVSYISRFESGRVTPNISTIERILRAADVDLIVLRVRPDR